VRKFLVKNCVVIKTLFKFGTLLFEVLSVLLMSTLLIYNLYSHCCLQNYIRYCLNHEVVAELCTSKVCLIIIIDIDIFFNCVIVLGLLISSCDNWKKNGLD